MMIINSIEISILSLKTERKDRQYRSILFILSKKKFGTANIAYFCPIKK